MESPAATFIFRPIGTVHSPYAATREIPKGLGAEHRADGTIEIFSEYEAGLLDIEAWHACRQDLRPPEEAMADYVAWLETLPGTPVFVGYPAGFDFLFVYWYLIRFAGRSPFSFSAVDIKTLAMALLGTDYRATTKRTMPRRWFGPVRHSHVALDDALEQGDLFCNLLAEARQRLGTG